MRTAYATAAVAATASAVEIDAMAVPDFIAGFIYGLTGDNQLTEIEQCYSGGQGLVDDAKIAIYDFKIGNYKEGAEAIGEIVNQFPTALSKCQNMDDDLAEIEAWAQIFTEPATLAKKVSKNWLLHKRKVKADIAQEEADWAAGSYFDAGKDTANAIDVLVPFSSSLTYGLEIEGALEFLAGFLDGFMDGNHLSEIQSCEVDAEKEAKAIEQAISDYEAGHKVKAIMELKNLVSNW